MRLMKRLPNYTIYDVSCYIQKNTPTYYSLLLIPRAKNVVTLRYNESVVKLDARFQLSCSFIWIYQKNVSLRLLSIFFILELIFCFLSFYLTFLPFLLLFYFSLSFPFFFFLYFFFLLLRTVISRLEKIPAPQISRYKRPYGA